METAILYGVGKKKTIVIILATNIIKDLHLEKLLEWNFSHSPRSFQKTHPDSCLSIKPIEMQHIMRHADVLSLTAYAMPLLSSYRQTNPQMWELYGFHSDAWWNIPDFGTPGSSNALLPLRYVTSHLRWPELRCKGNKKKTLQIFM